MSKESRVRALENKQCVNGFKDTVADTDCRLLIHGLGFTA